ELEMRQTADREDRQLLAAHEGRHAVDRADAGEDRLRWAVASPGIDRGARDPAPDGGRDRRAAVDGPSAPIADAPEPLLADRDGHRAAAERDPDAVESHARGALEELDHGDVLLDV